MDTTRLSQDCCGFWLADTLSLCLTSSMARTKKTLQMGEVKESYKYKWGQRYRMRQGIPGAGGLPAPEMEQALTQKELAQWVREAERHGGHWSCHQSNSWPRWLWRPGHPCWAGRSQPEGSSDLLWEARPPERNSWRLERWRGPKSTDQGPWPFTRSAGSKRALSSLFGKCPSHS